MRPKITYVDPVEAVRIMKDVYEWEKTRPDKNVLPKYRETGSDVVRLAVAEYIANQQNLTFFPEVADIVRQ